MKINRFAQKVSDFYQRVTIRSQPINFLSVAEDLNDCLVCMPSNMQFILDAASKLPDIAAIFPNRLIKVLLSSNIDPRSHEFIKRFTIIKPYSDDLNVFYLPKKSFINRISGEGLSICIDLDFEANFFNSSVSALTGAPLRIGCLKGMGLPYYNLEIGVTGGETPSRKSYEDFFNVLYNFKGEGEGIASIET